MIIGNGTAGLNAAKAIRERDATGSVLIVSNEPYSTYNRPMLTKTLMSELDPAQLAVEDEKWYSDHNIYQVLGKSAVRIDTAQKEVELSDGTRLKYTKLIYAAGSECFIPPIGGSDRSGVVAIRRFDDAKKVGTLLGKCPQCRCDRRRLSLAWKPHGSCAAQNAT